MGNKEANKTTSAIDQERARQQAQSDQMRSYMIPERMNEQQFSTGLRGDIVSGYKNLASGQDATGNQLAGLGSFGGGGYAPTLVSLDPSQAGLESRYKGLSGNLEGAAAGYKNFADTGGYSTSDIANTRSRGVEPVGAFYSNLKNTMATRNAVQGGYSPGMTASTARLARASAQESGKAARDTELGLQDAIRQGKIAGLGGMADIGKFGYGGEQGIADTRQRIAELNAQAANSAAASGAGSGAADARFRLQMQLAGLGGLQDVYGSQAGELSRYDTNLMGERGLTQEGIAGNLTQRNQNVGSVVSPWDRAAKIGGIAASAMLGGL